MGLDACQSNLTWQHHSEGQEEEIAGKRHKEDIVLKDEEHDTDDLSLVIHDIDELGLDIDLLDDGGYHSEV